ncbi:uncharacterized protein LOC119175746 isoform X6 [Rhipicephalus microplus]|uniref:uncharacterized protein LOC119175746 isoform X6 n=1 Tax=Rhipicephalus microplus TaxID=6941 RepID=UPI003F6C7121
MSASSLVCKRVLPKDARKLLRAVFPVLKEKDEDLKDITEKLKLVFNHDLNIRLNTYGINVYPIGHLETFARGVIGYNVGTRDSISRWLRLSNRKFVVKGCFGTDTCSYNSLGRVVETAPYDILCGPGFSPRVFVHDLGKETSIIQAALSCDRKLVYAVNNFPLEGHYCITRRRPSRSLRRRPSRFLPSFFTTTRAVAIRSRAAARMLFLKLRTKGKE